MLAYLNREQYGDWPILHGQYYNAQVVDFEDGNPVYKKDEESGMYVVTDQRKKSKYVYDKKFTGLLPRMWSAQDIMQKSIKMERTEKCKGAIL